MVYQFVGGPSDGVLLDVSSDESTFLVREFPLEQLNERLPASSQHVKTIVHVYWKEGNTFQYRGPYNEAE